jgi:hypothetical protein
MNIQVFSTQIDYLTETDLVSIQILIIVKMANIRNDSIFRLSEYLKVQ